MIQIAVKLTKTGYSGDSSAEAIIIPKVKELMLNLTWNLLRCPDVLLSKFHLTAFKMQKDRYL